MVVDTDEKRLMDQARQIEDLRQQLKDLWPPSELPQSKKGRVVGVVTSIVARGFGIPPDGSAYILRRDPLTHGRAVLERRCLGCHVDGGKGSGTQTASDLAGFGSRAWIRGLLENPQALPYFGKVPQCDGMAQWKESSKLKGSQLDDVAEFVASFARIPADMTPAEWLKSPEVSGHPGLKHFRPGGECGECHILAGLNKGGLREAPDLFAWGSPQWVARMIRKPNAADRYGFLEEEQKMPAFGSDQLTPNDLEMVTRYLQGDYIKAGASPTVEKSPTAPAPAPAKSP
jgi:ubiquinol-cytochrome c reductase cytochrome b subunit